MPDLLAQENPLPTRGDFMFPIRPRQENYLSGTMGELRSSHFHSGLDIKTSGITGLPVYATADGYVQRIRVSLTGYGNALYLVHPQNGTVSVYAHLKSFKDELATYVRQEQYKEESFQVDLYPDQHQFAFKKGDIIALSGNSGSSSGPHLHFEIRNLHHRALDPLDYGFEEIVDRTPPTLAQVAFVTLDQHSRVNGMYGRVEFDVVSDAEGNASIKEGISLYGNIGIEVYAYDRFDGANNRNGIRFQTFLFDGKPMYTQTLDQINFGLQRNILVHVNYKRFKEGGRKFNKMYKDEGNGLQMYDTGTTSGILKIIDPMQHRISFRLADSYGNISQFNFNVNDNGFERSRALKHTYSLDREGFDIMGDILELESEAGHCEVKFYLADTAYLVDMAYYTDSSHHFLWDLKDGLPDSAQVCDQTYQFNLSAMVPPEQKIGWKDEGIAINFPKYALFDTTYLRYEKRNTPDGLEIFDLQNATTPLRQFVTVSLRPDGAYDRNTTGVYGINGNQKLSYVGGEWEGDTLVFKTRDLVSYTLASDSIPPTITPKSSRKGQLEFMVKDEMSGIHSVRATLDGKWLLMNYDMKSGHLWSDEQVRIVGNFLLAVKDNANNITRFEAVY